MLSQEQFLKGLEFIKANYIKWEFDFNNDFMILAWYKKLSFLDEREFKELLTRYTDTRKFPPNSPADILLSKQAVISHFENEFKFLVDLPTVVETQKYIFVHGGLRKKQVSDNLEKSVFELTKFDAFAEKTSDVFDKYIIAGHWPVVLYSSDIPQMNPVINRDKKIISIDGGCGVKKDGQLNLLIIPDINCSVDEISHICYDEIPTAYALENQNSSKDPIYISWINREIRILDKSEEFSYIEHVKSGRKLHIPNAYLRNDTEAFDYTDYVLPVNKGDRLSVISRNSKGYLVKKDGVVGWYCGDLSSDPIHY